MRKRNRAMVIAAVRQAGQPSRTEIARVTGLSHSTISAIAADLLDEGVMREAGPGEAVPARRGRPQVALQLEADAARVVCLHLSFNKLSATLVNYRGEVIESWETRLSTLTLSREMLLQSAISAVQEVTQGHSDFMRISFAIQGVTDASCSELLWSPITPHRHIPFGPELEKTFDTPVAVHNDCNMIAVALRWRNPQRYRDNFIAILLSQGIGMGLMLNGGLFTGTLSSAGEFGHMTHKPDGALCRCGRRGCIEAYAGNYAVWRRARGADITEKPLDDVEAGEMEKLADLARHGDGPASQAFREAAEAIGYGIGGLFALIDPAPVAIIGHGTSAFDILEPHLHAALGETAGGQLSDAVNIETWPDETPFIQHGSAMTALTSLDQEIFGPGLPNGTGGRKDETISEAGVSA